MAAKRKNLVKADDNPRQTARRLPVDGLTEAERRRPAPQAESLSELERAGKRPSQLQLFIPGPVGRFAPNPGGMVALEPTSSLELARAWYRRELEQARRPSNTIESYCYDLVRLETQIGSKCIDRITRSDIARFLGNADNRSTRKRRLTSLRRFFRYLIEDAKVLEKDPTDGFYPHLIQLRSPMPLFADEQEAFLAVAAEDEPWSLPAIWLMLRLGLSRGELLALRREHIDLADPDRPVVYIVYDDVTKQSKERRLATDIAFAEIYADYLERRTPADVLFPVTFQTINGMVDRVRKNAEIEKAVTPQTLRHTFAVERAKAGADESDLLAVLGLVDDPRNRASVRRYLKLAEPPIETNADDVPTDQLEDV